MLNGLDPLGVASFLSLGWSVANSTLVRGIECVPGGQHWCWRAPCDQSQQRQYFGRDKLTRPKQMPLRMEEVAALGETLLNIDEKVTADLYRKVVDPTDMSRFDAAQRALTARIL